MDDFEEENGPGLNERMGPLLEKSKKAFSQLSAIIKKIGVAKIIIALIIIAVAYYVITLPQPGTLTVNVLALDSGVPVNNAIVSLTSNGVSVGNPPSETTSSGSAIFTGVPSDVNIQINVDGTPSYSVLTDSITLQSGQSQSITENLPLNYQLSFNPSSENNLTATPTCVMNKSVSITNNDNTSSVSFSLTGDKDLQGLVNSQKTTIPPGQTMSIPYTIDFNKGAFSSGGSASGNIRPYGFNNGDSLTFSFSSFQFQVSPTEISCSSGQTCTGYITIQNTGTNSITGLQAPTSNIITSGTPSSTITITPISGNSIAPGKSASYYYSLTANVGSKAGGSVNFNGDCFNAQVLIQVQ
jgi:hypothetical protein